MPMPWKLIKDNKTLMFIAFDRSDTDSTNRAAHDGIANNVSSVQFDLIYFSIEAMCVGGIVNLQDKRTNRTND